MATLLLSYEQLANEALLANLRREQEVRKLYKENIAAVAPGGAMEKSVLADIERGAKKIVSGETQQMISSGLYGTTTTAGIPGRVEREYAQPARIKLEDVLEQRRGAARSEYAQFIERIQDPYPDYSALMQAYAAKGSTGGYGGFTTTPREETAMYGVPTSPAQTDYTSVYAAREKAAEAAASVPSGVSLQTTPTLDYFTPSTSNFSTALLQAYGLVPTKQSTPKDEWKKKGYSV